MVGETWTCHTHMNVVAAMGPNKLKRTPLGVSVDSPHAAKVRRVRLRPRADPTQIESPPPPTTPPTGHEFARSRQPSARNRFLTIPTCETDGEKGRLGVARAASYRVSLSWRDLVGEERLSDRERVAHTHMEATHGGET